MLTAFPNIIKDSKDVAPYSTQACPTPISTNMSPEIIPARKYMVSFMEGRYNAKYRNIKLREVKIPPSATFLPNLNTTLLYAVYQVSTHTFTAAVRTNKTFTHTAYISSSCAISSIVAIVLISVVGIGYPV